MPSDSGSTFGAWRPGRGGVAGRGGAVEWSIVTPCARCCIGLLAPRDQLTAVRRDSGAAAA